MRRGCRRSTRQSPNYRAIASTRDSMPSHHQATAPAKFAMLAGMRRASSLVNASTRQLLTRRGLEVCIAAACDISATASAGSGLS
jgi:hypothetical protein